MGSTLGYSYISYVDFRPAYVTKGSLVGFSSLIHTGLGGITGLATLEVKDNKAKPDLASLGNRIDGLLTVIKTLKGF